MRRVLFAGTQHLTTAEQKLQPVLADWSRDWCLTKGSHDIACIAKLAVAAAGTGEPVVLAARHGQSGDAALLGDASIWRQVLFGALHDDLPVDEVSAHISDQAQMALLEAVLIALAGEAGTAAPAADFREGYVLVEILVNHVRLLLGVAVGLIAQGKSTQQAVSPELVQRGAAIGEATVEVQIELPMLTVAMSDFVGLKPGDIIRSESGLHTLFSLKIGDRTLPAKASLGVQGDRKAIRLEA